jgi:hypothetical protein
VPDACEVTLPRVGPACGKLRKGSLKPIERSEDRASQSDLLITSGLHFLAHAG